MLPTGLKTLRFSASSHIATAGFAGDLSRGLMCTGFRRYSGSPSNSTT